MLLTINNIAKAYGDNQVLNQASFALDHGQKLGLVGANGVGKSTLLKLIVGELEPDSGEAWVASGAEVGYLPQVLAAASNQTIDELLDGALGNLTTIAARLRALEQLMAHPDGDLTALFSEYSALTARFEASGGYDVTHRIEQISAGLGIAHLPRKRTIGTLSGGEKSRDRLGRLAAPRRRICSCWTSQPTISISPRWVGWKAICKPLAAACWSFRMIASS